MQKLEQFVADLNLSWREGRFEDLATFFHDEVVMLNPGSSRGVVGVTPMVDSYRQFATTAKVLEFKTTDPQFFPRGDVVMCHLKFHIKYEMQGNPYEDAGMDVYAIVDVDNQPKIAWRTQIGL